MTRGRLSERDIPNHSSFGRLALELPRVPLFELGCRLAWGAGGRGSEGSFVASLSFGFGHLQIHASVVSTVKVTVLLKCPTMNETVIKSCDVIILIQRQAMCPCY